MSILSAEDIVNHSGDVEAALMEKREAARESYAATGSFPEEWEIYSKIFEGRGRPPKYSSADQYHEKGVAYFRNCIERGKNFTITGLSLWMGFANPSTMRQHAEASHEFRNLRAQFYSIIREAVEETVTNPGGQPGKMFVMKNIPDCITATDDVSYKEVSIWADKQTTELTGAGGGPLVIDRGLKPEEAYMLMLEGGTLSEKDKQEQEGQQAQDEIEDAMSSLEGEA